jgi:glycosyl transferase, family 25
MSYRTPATVIRVISLKDSIERRTEFSGQVAGFDLDWSFFSAYNGIVLPLSYSDRDAVRHCGRALFPPEIGCYVSHFKCWEWLANSEYDQAIILEDDVMMDWRAITQLSQLNLSAYRIELMRLYATHPIACKIVMYRFLSPHCHLVRTSGWYLGMQGYLLTKNGARRLIKKYAHITVPVDWVLTRYWEHRLGNYSLFPFPVIEKHVSSTIVERSSTTKVQFSDWTIRYFQRILDRMKREWFDRWTAERRPLGTTIDAGRVFINNKTM